MLLMDFTSLQPDFRGRRLLLFLVLAAVLLFTVLVFDRMAEVVEAQDRARSEARVQDVHARIESRLETYTALLQAGTGLFAGSEGVEQNEFRSFVMSLGLDEHYPGVQGIGFALRLKPEEKAAVVEARK